MAVSVLYLFLAMSGADMWFVIVTFPGHTPLPFGASEKFHYGMSILSTTEKKSWLLAHLSRRLMGELIV